MLCGAPVMPCKLSSSSSLWRLLCCAIRLARHSSLPALVNHILSLSNIENIFYGFSFVNAQQENRPSSVLLKNSLSRWSAFLNSRKQWKKFIRSVAKWKQHVERSGRRIVVAHCGRAWACVWWMNVERNLISLRLIGQRVKKRSETLLSIALSRRLCGRTRETLRAKFYRLHSYPFSKNRSSMQRTRRKIVRWESFPGGSYTKQKVMRGGRINMSARRMSEIEGWNCSSYF